MTSPAVRPPTPRFAVFPNVVLPGWRVEFTVTTGPPNGWRLGRAVVGCERLPACQIDLTNAPHCQWRPIDALPGDYTFTLNWSAVNTASGGATTHPGSDQTAAVRVTTEIHAALWGFVRQEEEMTKRDPVRATAQLAVLRTGYDTWRATVHPPDKGWQRLLYEDEAPDYGGANGFPTFDQELDRQRQALAVLGDLQREALNRERLRKWGVRPNRPIDREEVHGDKLGDLHAHKGYTLHPPTADGAAVLLSVAVKRKTAELYRGEKRTGVVTQADGWESGHASPLGERPEADFAAFAHYLALERLGNGSIPEQVEAAVEELRSVLRLPPDGEDSLREWVLLRGGELAKRPDPWDDDRQRTLVADALRYGQGRWAGEYLTGDPYQPAAAGQLAEMDRVLELDARKARPDPAARLAVGVGRRLDEADGWSARKVGDRLGGGSLFRRFVRLYRACHYLSECARWVEYLDGPPVRWPAGVPQWVGFTSSEMLDATFGPKKGFNTPFKQLARQVPPLAPAPGWHPDQPDPIALLLLLCWSRLHLDVAKATDKRVRRAEALASEWRAVAAGHRGDDDVRRTATAIIELHNELSAAKLGW